MGDAGKGYQTIWIADAYEEGNISKDEFEAYKKKYNLN
jgi:hypothetical protein